MSTNEAHSDGILYENLNKEVPDSNDYEQLRETDTILDSKMYVFLPVFNVCIFTQIQYIDTYEC